MRRNARSLVQSGFTLIELMVVVAIIGILAAVAIPAFMKNARKAKTAEATINVKKMYDGARAYYEEELVGRGQGRYPGLLIEMVPGGHLDAELASGESNGYSFLLKTEPGGQSFTLTANPLVRGVTGESILEIDETGAFETHPDPEVEKVDATLRAEGLAAIESLNGLSGGAALDLARALGQSPKDVAAVLAALDPPTGAPPTGRSLLDRVPVAIGLPQFRVGDDGRFEGDDAEMAKLLDAYLARVRAILKPILDDPLGPDPSPEEASAAVVKLLAQARSATAAEAIAHLGTLVAGLGAHELTPDTTDGDEKCRARLADAAEKARLAAEVEDWTRARRELVRIRQRFDDERSPPDWVTGAAAARLMHQMDLGLRLIPQ